MAAATCAQHFGARLEQAVIGAGDDRVRQRTEEAGPAGAAVELGGRREKRVAAARAAEDAAAMLVVERARSRPLGRRLAQGGILGRVEPLPPLGVGQPERKIARLGGGIGAAVPARQSESNARDHRRAAKSQKGTSVQIHDAASAPCEINRARTRPRNALPMKKPCARSAALRSASLARPSSIRRARRMPGSSPRDSGGVSSMSSRSTNRVVKLPSVRKSSGSANRVSNAPE